MPIVGDVGRAVPDMVNRPAHYTHGDIECIDAMRAMLGHAGFVAYLRGTIVKYQWRMLHKGNAVEDAAKAGWYIRRLEDELMRVASEQDRPVAKDPALGAPYVGIAAASLGRG